jgi:arsenate reductase (thioredoxin)
MTKARTFKRRTVVLAGSAVALGLSREAAHALAAPDVLFICEHGYAKSLVAALHCERLAASRGTAVRALSRGVDPGTRVPPGIAAGLAADGFDVSAFAPSRPTPEEIGAAAHVVLIGVDVDVSSRAGPVTRWDDILPLSENYERARGEIVARLNILLDQMGGRV